MKVLLIANINSTHTRKWAGALRKKNIQVGLFSLNFPVTGDGWWKELDFVFYPEKNGIFPFNYISILRILKRTLRSFRPDILHSHFITHHSLIGHLSEFKPHLITTWGSDVFSFPRKNAVNKAIIKYNLKKATGIVSTSLVMAQELAKYTDRPVTVIPFGIDLKLYRFKEHVFPKKEFHIGCFKKIEPIYGTDSLIKVFSTLVKEVQDVKLFLHLVGDGNQLDEIRSMVKALDLEKHVVFHGWTDPSKVPQLLTQMDLCIYMSRHESFGVSLLESMASGVPLLVTKTPGFIEVARNDSNARFVEIDDIETAVRCVKDLITDKDQYLSLVQNGYDLVKKHYDLEQNISEQIDVYKRLLKG